MLSCLSIVMNFQKVSNMIWKIERSGPWFNVVVVSTNKVEDGFNNKEDAERFVAHLEAEDGRNVING